MNDPFFKICDSVKSSMEQKATEINPAFKNYFVLKNCEFTTVKELNIGNTDPFIHALETCCPFPLFLLREERSSPTCCTKCTFVCFTFV